MVDYAYLETTSYCNLSCSGCNRDLVVSRSSHMSISQFEKILDKLKDESLAEIKLMGMGEPYLNTEFSKICRYARQKFPNAFIISATNCNYLLSSNFEKSLAYLNMVYLSIDGIGTTFESIRRGGKWSKTLKFLSDLQTIDRKQCKLPINFTVYKKNYTQIPSIIELAKEFNLDGVRLNLAQDWNEDTNNIEHWTEDELTYLRQYANLFQGKTEWEYSDCFWPKRGVYMTTRGDIKTCCMNTGGISHGNLFETSLSDIRNTESFKLIKRGCETNKPVSHCATCSYMHIKPYLSKILK